MNHCSACLIVITLPSTVVLRKAVEHEVFRRDASSIAIAYNPPRTHCSLHSSTEMLHRQRFPFFDFFSVCHNLSVLFYAEEVRAAFEGDASRSHFADAEEEAGGGEGGGGGG